MGVRACEVITPVDPRCRAGVAAKTVRIGSGIDKQRRAATDERYAHQIGVHVSGEEFRLVGGTRSEYAASRFMVIEKKRETALRKFDEAKLFGLLGFRRQHAAEQPVCPRDRWRAESDGSDARRKQCAIDLPQRRGVSTSSIIEWKQVNVAAVADIRRVTVGTGEQRLQS